jgi:MFS family permease
MNAAIARLGDERVRLVGLISAGHFMSHFFILVLYPVLPLVAADLGVGFALLGAVLTAYSIANAVCQIPMGFLVDRFGGRLVLSAGLGLHGLAFASVWFTESYWALFAAYAVAGIGQAVFHPADYAILSARIDRSHLGRAVSVHTFAGNVGWGLAPPVVLVLTALVNWRFAFLMVGLVAFAIAVIIYAQRDLVGRAAPQAVRPADAQGKRPSTFRDGLKLMKSPALLILFAFFLFSSLAGSGINSVTVVSLMRIYETDIIGANVPLTGYLWGTAAGVLVGGWLADRFNRPNLIAGGSMLGAAVCIAIVPLGILPLALVVVAMTLVGTFTGAAAPSRDILVRQASGPNTVGVAFGFTSTGFSVAGATMPPLFGILLDTGRMDIAYGIMVAALLVAVVACYSRGGGDAPR